MRLFVAIPLPEAIRDKLVALHDAAIPHANWVKPETFHLTLKFLGDGIDEGRLPAIQAALAEVHSPAFTVQVQGVGRFPASMKQAARVLWAGVSQPPELLTLYNAVEAAMTAPQPGLGFLHERHPYSPHLTLARLKSEKTDPSVEAFLTRHAEFEGGTFEANTFHLYSSQLTPEGSRYTVLDSFYLH